MYGVDPGGAKVERGAYADMVISNCMYSLAFFIKKILTNAPSPIRIRKLN